MKEEIYDSEARTTFDEIERRTLVCNEIKYAAYRTASKLRIWQKSLRFDHVTLSVIRNVFNHHHILVTDSKVVLSADEVESILSDILFAASKLGCVSFHVDNAVKLTLDFLTSAFKSSGGLNVLDLKVGLVCLCAAPLNEKYSYFFSQMADHNLCLSRKKVKRLLESLLKLPMFLGEYNSFNCSYIESTLDSGFQRSSELGVTESEFICWLVREPQMLIWLSTLYRIQASENVSHNVKCAVCSTKPIKGLRYICMRCINYDLCQHCFFTGKKSKRHQAQHEIREYCAKASNYETLVLYVKGIIGRIFGNPARLQYLPAVASAHVPASNESSFNISHPAALSPTKLGFDETNASSNQRPGDQLNLIIEKIEQETREFMKAAKSNTAADVIEQHTAFLNEQLDSLRALKTGLHRNEAAIFMSTPIVPTGAPREVLQTPLLLDEESTWTPPSPSRFSMWQNCCDNDAQGETSYSLKLQRDLDMIMVKLNGLIDQTHVENETSLTKL